MSARRVAMLFIAAFAVIALALWLSAQRHLERATMAADLVLPGLAGELGRVTRLELRKGDGTHATLQRESSDWRVAERGWPADTRKVRKLLLDLSALNVVEEKTHLAANYAQLGVEDVGSPQSSGTEVTISSAAHHWTLIAGKASSAKAGFVRVVGKPTSLLAAPLVSVDAEPRSWLRTALLDIPAEQVRAVKVQPAAGPVYGALRDKAATPFTVAPLPKHRVLSSPDAADPLASALRALSFDDVQRVPAGAATAADGTAVPHTVFVTFDGLTVEAWGRKDTARNWVRFAVRAGQPAAEQRARELSARLTGWEFALADYRYDQIFKPLEDLLQPPEPAKPKPQGAEAR